MSKQEYLEYRAALAQFESFRDFAKTAFKETNPEIHEKINRNIKRIHERDKLTGKRRNTLLVGYEVERIAEYGLTDHAPANRLMEGLAALAHHVALYRNSANRVEPYQPLQDALRATENDASAASRNTLPVRVDFKATNDTNVRNRVSPMWRHQVKAAGGASIGNRFVTRAELVDVIGEFDLFQIEYMMGNDGEIKHGFLARYRDTNIRGFGTRADTALQWARRQVVLYGTRKLAK